jgi:hypothetical protein
MRDKDEEDLHYYGLPPYKPGKGPLEPLRLLRWKLTKPWRRFQRWVALSIDGPGDPRA